jgi:tetratricopeptide (TPR) repeat protein
VVQVITEKRAAVRDDPRSGEAWGELGRALMVNEIHSDISLACFTEAERLDPKNPRWPYFSGGILAVTLHKPEEAIAKLQRAVELCDRGDRQGTPRLLLAETLLSLGQLEDAERHFQQVLATDPRNVRAHYGLGLVASARGDWHNCRKQLETCLSSPQAGKKARIHLAAVCERLGDKKSADKYTTEAARLPGDADWMDPFRAEHLQLAKRKMDRYRAVEYLEAAGHFDQAVSILADLVQKYPNDYLPHLMMGRILPQMGKFQPAEEHLRTALQLAPDKIQVYYLLGLVLFERGLFEESAQFARKALALNPDYGYAHMCLGRALKALGDRKEALKALRQAVHCNPEFADNHLHLGILLAEEGKRDEARSCLRQAQLLAPNDPRPKAELEKLR